MVARGFTTLPVMVVRAWRDRIRGAVRSKHPISVEENTADLKKSVFTSLNFLKGSCMR